MNHYQEAERLLAIAEELAAGPRVGVARTLAAIGQGHATLALVKATRQDTNDLEAARYDEGWMAHVIASLPPGLDPREQLLAAVQSVRENPYRQGVDPRG